MKLTDLRTSFLDFFQQEKHEIIKSSPLVPHNDPSLMFVNAGMVQFKDVFTGKEVRPYSRATSSQKCVRAGGKHNDLDNVGYTARHHTFFEMLGNFSFGDYFKEDAIKYAWDFLTKEIGLPPEKLYVTIYHDDEEAYKIWKKISGFSDDKIIRIATNDNFWSMGDTGPCGPSSEIFYDHGDKVAGGLPGTPEEDGDRYIEIWNLVFMQYETLADGKRVNLPKPSIDTGMGLERMAALLQGKHNNYETDLFLNLISAIEDNCKVKATEANISSFRVIADHLRSVSFLIADGVSPSNEGRGYVLRRILRRAVRHINQIGVKQTVLANLLPSLVTEMGNSFEEIKRAEKYVAQTMHSEEERFRTTLDKGLKILDEELKQINNNMLSGQAAFKLYDTYGFPLDLTQDILRGKNLQVDSQGFDEAMQKQKEMARAAWKGSGAKETDEKWFEVKQKHGSTEFLGYESDKCSAKVIEVMPSSDSITMVLTNQTVFYAESGGQVGDCGTITVGSDSFEVISTSKLLGSLHVHNVKDAGHRIKVGDSVNLLINNRNRRNIKANHSATHLLHAVLKQVLGEHVTQKGSLVAADKMRFDFSNPNAVPLDKLMEVERIVNSHIAANSTVSTKLMETEDAIKEGATALFGEKYDDEVRVLTMGDAKFSVELCGGTHVERTGDIGLFKITSEEAVASGIRRLECLTGEAALLFAQEQELQIKNLAANLKVPVVGVLPRVEKLQEEKKQLEKQIADIKKKLALSGGGQNALNKQEVDGLLFISNKFDGLAANDLRGVAEDLRKNNSNGVIALFSNIDGRLSIVTACGEDAKQKISAVDVVRKAAEATGGKGGGGKDFLAQGGGIDPSKVDYAIEEIIKLAS